MSVLDIDSEMHSSDINSIIFIHCKWIIFLVNFMHVFMCLPTTTSSTLWPVPWVTSAELLEVVGLLASEAFLSIGRAFPRWVIVTTISTFALPLYHLCNWYCGQISPLPPLLLQFCLLDLFISSTSAVSGLFTFCRKVLLSFSVSIVLLTVLAIVRHSIRVLVPFILSKGCILDPWVLVVCKEQKFYYFIRISEAAVISNFFQFQHKVCLRLEWTGVLSPKLIPALEERLCWLEVSFKCIEYMLNICLGFSYTEFKLIINTIWLWAKSIE